MKLSKKIHKAHIEFDIDKRKEIGYMITYNQFEELEALEKQVKELKEALQYLGKTFDEGWKDEDDEYWRTYLNEGNK